jgi:hypothetical protein
MLVGSLQEVQLHLQTECVFEKLKGYLLAMEARVVSLETTVQQQHNEIIQLRLGLSSDREPDRVPRTSVENGTLSVFESKTQVLESVRVFSGNEAS